MDEFSKFLKQAWPTIALVGGVITAITAWLLNIIKIRQELRVSREPVEKLGGKSASTNPNSRTEIPEPSATQLLLDRLQALSVHLKGLGATQAPDLAAAIETHLSGRQQVLGPIRKGLLETLHRAKKQISVSTKGALIQQIQSHLTAIEKAHDSLRKFGSNALVSIWGNLPDAIVLADYSTPLSKILLSLAQLYAAKQGSVTIHLISSDTKFLSSQDTQRWEDLLGRGDYARFFQVQDPIAFSKAEDLFCRLSKEKVSTILCLGAESVFEDGRITVFPGIRAVAATAMRWNSKVLVVSETYKVGVQPEGINAEFGTDTDGDVVELATLEYGEGLSYVSDHKWHRLDSQSFNDNLGITWLQPELPFRCCRMHRYNDVHGTCYPSAVVFDFDGTLIDSESIQRKLYQDVADSLGFSLTDDIYDRDLQGRTDSATIEEIVRLSGRTANIDQLAKRKQEAFLKELREGRIRAMPGIHKFLVKLSTMPFLLAVATSATTEEVVTGLRALQLDKYFHIVVASEAVVNSKPAPDVFLRVATELAIVPEDCFVFEDAVPGVQAAVAAHMRVAGIGNTLNNEKIKAGAMLVVHDYSDTLFLLEQIGSTR